MAKFDPLYKKLFNHPEFMEDLLRQVFHRHRTFLDSVDFSTARKIPSELISKSLHRRYVDYIWQCDSIDGNEIFIFLFEFQSTVDVDMGLRILTYSSMLLESLITHQQYRSKPEQHYPAILPLVLYNGTSKWSASLNAHANFSTIADGLDACLPSQQYILVDEKQWAQSLTGERSLFTALATIMHGETPEQTLAALDAVNEWLDDGVSGTALKRTIVEFFIQTAKQKYPELKAIAEDIIMGEWRNALAETMDRWAVDLKAEGHQEGHQKGLQRGFEEGARNTLQLQLTHKFGQLPATITERIKTADRYQLARWAERVIDAERLAHIFND